MWERTSRKRARIKAIHEDISKLVDQVQAVTQATKEIEAKISDQVWNRQKQWELKREVIFEATRALARIEDALVGIHSVTQVEKQPNNVTWVTAKHDKTLEWTKSYSAFEEASLLVAAVCSKEAGQGFQRYGAFLIGVATRIAQDDDGDIYKKSQVERNKKHLELQNVIRKELGVDPVVG
jgi:hypothetical protein